MEGSCIIYIYNVRSKGDVVCQNITLQIIFALRYQFSSQKLENMLQQLEHMIIFFKMHRIAMRFLQRSYDALWRELLSETAKIFDSAGKGTNKNCTLLRLKELCFDKQYAFLFPNGEKDTLVQLLDLLFKKYNQLPIKKSRRKQLAHHDLDQTIAGKCITISLEQIESLIADATDVFTKIYMRFCLECVEISFPDYGLLVGHYEDALKKL